MDPIVLVRNKVGADLLSGIHPISDRAVEHSDNFLTHCVGTIESLIAGSIVPLFKCKSSAKTVLDLNEAERIFGIDRDILLTAMVNHQLPSSFSDKGHQIKYKDLEQFVDCYFYRKNLVSGSYVPKGELS
jgi:hypothetical protein